MNGAPPWYALAPEAGAVPCERGEHGFWSCYSTDRHRWLSDADCMGAEVVCGDIEGGKGAVFYTAREAVEWLLNGPGPDEA